MFGTFRKSIHECVIPEGHYLYTLKEFNEEKCKEILEETPWKPETYKPVHNGFVLAASEAYNYHHNLVIRPDDVWVAVTNQFSAYVNGNAESLRTLFVNHEGKKELVTCQMASLRSADYGELARHMVEEMKKRIVDPELAKWILPSFSTTQVNDTIVGSVVFMASMQKYFEYKFHLLCGIPNVTLLGTVEDWEDIYKRISFLRQFGDFCNKWADMLEKVIIQFVNARKGSPDMSFWNRICSNLGGGSGPRYLSGWITTFCVFNNDGKWQGDQYDIVNCGKETMSEFPIVNTNDIPSGYVTVPVKIDDNGIAEYYSIMFAGHMSIAKVDDTTIQPHLSWVIALKA